MRVRILPGAYIVTGETQMIQTHKVQGTKFIQKEASLKCVKIETDRIAGMNSV